MKRGQGRPSGGLLCPRGERESDWRDRSGEQVSKGVVVVGDGDGAEGGGGNRFVREDEGGDEAGVIGGPESGRGFVRDGVADDVHGDGGDAAVGEDEIDALVGGGSGIVYQFVLAPGEAGLAGVGDEPGVGETGGDEAVIGGTRAVGG